MHELVNLTLHKQIYKDGHEARIVDHLIEEMAELTQKLMQIRRKRPITRNDLVEEIADVKICLAYLEYDNGVGETELTKMIQKKNLKMRNQLEKLKNG